ncbi:MAG: YciI family protein [Candidatus Dormibacteraeota bacterium]|nr:YciI family protein [Candidatus Dormibacteraeota bacterium]MBV9524466.1 YciI family protein [Candidatus Dormibacteraeota bacterium]
MKYALMFIREDEEGFLSRPDHGDVYQSINRFFMDLGSNGKIANPGAELQPMTTATTVRWAEGKPLVTDGPFMETKEGIGGFTIIEAEDLDEAIAIAQRWPAHDHAVEIRPIVEHGEMGM